jgi:adenylosuccinate synthase
MIKYADIIVDLQAGDTGKGKVAHSLAKTDNEYTHVIRYNGGGNAGHTIYHNGVQYVTHYIPVGVIYGIKSIIGPGCVVNPEKLEEEIVELEKGGFKVRENLMIDRRVHITKPEYVEEDSKDEKIGTTKTGNGQTYREKYNRTGLRAEDCEEVFDYVIDIYDELHGKENVKILFEGAQGFELDIDWGDYPYVTSSHCTVAGALQNGVPVQSVRKVYGVSKAYRTYVGNKNFEEPSRTFNLIRELGKEYGATTGRPRQIGWFDIDDIKKSIKINGVTNLVVNKIDVLEQAKVFKLRDRGNLLTFNDKRLFKGFIVQELLKECSTLKEVMFSESPYEI